MKIVDSATTANGSRIEVGSVVKLITGGARMAVNMIQRGETESGAAAFIVTCVWHCETGHPTAAQYDPRVLVTEQ